MTRIHFLLIALLIGFSTLIGCGDDGTTDGPADATSSSDVTNLPIPEHECGYDAECEGKLADLTPCEDAVCEQGVCVKEVRAEFADCVHPDAGTCEGGYCNNNGQCVVREAENGTPCNQSDWTKCMIGECAEGICANVSVY